VLFVLSTTLTVTGITPAPVIPAEVPDRAVELTARYKVPTWIPDAHSAPVADN